MAGHERCHGQWRAASGRRQPLPACRRASLTTAGFTLLEVLVALVILALALGALVKTTGDQVALLDDLDTRTQAFLIAENQLHRFQTERLWPEASIRKDRVDQAGRRWFWQASFENTPDPDLRRVVLDVRTAEEGPLAARLTGFLARPR
ncbi:MAG: type II secretion system minor pseudopilin GspI [Pseudomonadota bacterium]